MGSVTSYLMTIGKAETRYAQNGHKKEHAFSVPHEAIKIRVEYASWLILTVTLFHCKLANASLVTKGTLSRMENVLKIQVQ